MTWSLSTSEHPPAFGGGRTACDLKAGSQPSHPHPQLHTGSQASVPSSKRHNPGPCLLQGPPGRRGRNGPALLGHAAVTLSGWGGFKERGEGDPCGRHQAAQDCAQRLPHSCLPAANTGCTEALAVFSKTLTRSPPRYPAADIPSAPRQPRPKLPGCGVTIPQTPRTTGASAQP